MKDPSLKSWEPINAERIAIKNAILNKLSDAAPAAFAGRKFAKKNNKNKKKIGGTAVEESVVFKGKYLQ